MRHQKHSQKHTKSQRERDRHTARERESERVMGSSEAEPEQNTIPLPRLPLFPPQMQSPERSGMVTPPLHTSASVPFRWEEEPGKPRPCTALVSFSKPTNFSPKCLELPPRLLIDAKLSRLLPSPTTVLEGPYVGSKSNSFRKACYGSFSAERGQLGAMVLSKGVGVKDKGWFGSWQKKASKVKREVSVCGGSHVFPSSADREIDHIGTIGGSHNKVKMTKMKRSGSFSNLFHCKSRVWTTICEGLKQVVPWRSKKLKKDGYGLRR